MIEPSGRWAADLIGRPTDAASLVEMGRRLMPPAVCVAATGLVGFAAQEGVRTSDASQDLLVTHRTLSIGLLALSAGLAAIRARSRRPSAGYLLAGLAGAALVTYSGYLGGWMVYTHGVGVTPAGGIEPERTPEMPHDGFGRAARASASNVGHALRHTAQEMVQREIVPRFQEHPPITEPAAG